MEVEFRDTQAEMLQMVALLTTHSSVSGLQSAPQMCHNHYHDS